MTRPVVLLPCDVKAFGSYPFHSVGEKYINAVTHGAGAMPLLLPAWGQGQDMRDCLETSSLKPLLESVDGLFLTGSVSNVHPSRYDSGLAALRPDAQRDALVFPLIDFALDIGLPVLAVCRGIQELNVAMGGTLNPSVHATQGYLDHREPTDVSRDEQYSPRHQIYLTEQGRISGWLPSGDYWVNSLHGQGLDRLASGLCVEATAEDGLVEAVSVPGSWVFGVQWHPEWHFQEDLLSKTLFQEFGAAVRLRQEMRV
ncbi:MAG: gamma-glutamyl-gamma-aminobutyrate hydrolase family protein [Gammaproteobacteria bacterium]|jgi:putative glutamine amidotransferase|nr:gamma-glutamyl-gamma-aminobutyrate hydrolase family protein [Gammaproteobacteria bacterium]MBT5202434.1 gamma-glutamyl-gamma-aminobutyrate hydrolase family protein [Gammaproteobacteria bacterium]MBT6243785.1 gamma-glutamyl-gamma-aminobutyrate hydrolase family protein [Gammaproteobacteria bacterium]